MGAIVGVRPTPQMDAQLQGTDPNTLNTKLLSTLYGVMDALDSADNDDRDAVRRIKGCRYAKDARELLYKHYRYFAH